MISDAPDIKNGSIVFFIFRSIFSLFFLSLSLSAGQSVCIIEIKAVNHSIITDETGTYSDWIELYDASDDTVDIKGWFLSDNTLNLIKFRLHSSNSSDFILPPQTYILLGVGKDLTVSQYHLNFKLSNKCETHFFSDNTGSVIKDNLYFGKHHDDISFGSHPEDLHTTVFFATAAPGSPKRQAVLTQFDPPAISTSGSNFSHPLTVTVSYSVPQDILAYTIDGSHPVISDSTISEKSFFTTKKTTLIARSFSRINSQRSSVITETFILGEDFTLPTISLVTNPAILWNCQYGSSTQSTSGLYLFNLTTTNSELTDSLQSAST